MSDETNLNFLASTYEVVKISQTAPLLQCLRKGSVNDVQYKQRAVIEFLVASKESIRNTH